MKPARLSEAQLGITAAAVSGDSGLLYRLAADLLDDGTPFDVVLFDMLLGSEASIGSRWQAGDYLVSEEHAATATLETVVSLLAGSFDQPDDGPSVVVAVSEGDNHSLPARAVAAYLLSMGYRTVFLGANVLASDLGDFLMSQPPDAVVLSCKMSTHLVGARAAVRQIHDAGVPVLVGGEGFGVGGVWAAPVGADAWVRSGRDVPGVLNTWNPDPSSAEALARDPDEVLQTVLDRRYSVLATAEDWLIGLSRTSIGSRERTEMALVLDATAAAGLVGDRRLLAEFLAWQHETLTEHGVDTRLTEAVSVALAPIAPGLAAWIEAGPTAV